MDDEGLENGAAAGSRRQASVTALLDAAAEILSTSHPGDASLSEISARSGTNAAMVKYYFGNKEGMFVALLERDAEGAMSALSQLVAMPISADRKLRIHIEGIINTYHRSPYLNRLIHYVIENGEKASSRRVTEIFITPIIDAYRAIVDQGIMEGSLKPVDPTLLYYALVGSAEHIFFAGYSVPQTLGVDRMDEGLKRRYTDLVSGIFTAGLSAQPTSP